MDSQGRFENFKHDRSVFVFENPDTKDCISINMRDGEFSPIKDLDIINMILHYNGNLKCDIRVETKALGGEIMITRGFEWKQLYEYDSDIRYRFFYSSRNHVLACEGHLWQVTKPRSSVIDALYALAAKHYIGARYKHAVRLLYKSLKLINRAQIEINKITMIDRINPQVGSISWDHSDTVAAVNKIIALPLKFYIIKPYKDLIVCTICDDECCKIRGLRGDEYSIPVHLLAEFIYKYF